MTPTLEGPCSAWVWGATPIAWPRRRTGVRTCHRKQHSHGGTGAAGRFCSDSGWPPSRGGGGTVPSVAVGAGEAPVDEHAAHAAGVQAELAQVRAATARFHRVEEAVAAGYELGWVNGSGVRIVAGCVAHPTAGRWGTTTSTPT